eukprot:CAMPEP_0170643302 /NCGR_PEP_ID=MMETSP0224-20130122/41808_1 /TAXON_ID=285029 /ORGANISM="Togula jolla, Strain CCCM 725" /LENGTH=40 /DNA_ID= /DNA_START= /DNA_END= /DNA_ORIENTATION=
MTDQSKLQTHSQSETHGDGVHTQEDGALPRSSHADPGPAS